MGNELCISNVALGFLTTILIRFPCTALSGFVCQAFRESV